MRFPWNLDSNKERCEFASILSEIFQDTSICSSRREQVFSQSGNLRRLLARFLAPQLKPLLVPLGALRNVLVTGYLGRGHEFNDLSSYSTLYKFLWMTLTTCQDLMQKKLEFAKLKRKFPSLSTKDDDELLHDKERAVKKPKTEAVGYVESLFH